MPMPHPAAVGERNVSDKPRWVRALPPLSPQQRASYTEKRRSEYESLLAVDDAMRSLDLALAARGALDDTIVIFLTDNGYSFGEHRWETKSCAYDPCVRTPFLVRVPGQTSRVDSQLVSNVDVAPTIEALARVQPAAPTDGQVLPLEPESASGSQATPPRKAVLMQWAGGSSEDRRRFRRGGACGPRTTSTSRTPTESASCTTSPGVSVPRTRRSCATGPATPSMRACSTDSRRCCRDCARSRPSRHRAPGGIRTRPAPSDEGSGMPDNVRLESDSMGEIEVPADRYWGAQTQRSLLHFPIGDDPIPLEVAHAFGTLKKAAALVNAEAGRLPSGVADLIVQAADEVIGGRLDAEFPLGLADRFGDPAEYDRLTRSARPGRPSCRRASSGARIRCTRTIT